MNKAAKLDMAWNNAKIYFETHPPAGHAPFDAVWGGAGFYISSDWRFQISAPLIKAVLI